MGGCEGEGGGGILTTTMLVQDLSTNLSYSLLLVCVSLLCTNVLVCTGLDITFVGELPRALLARIGSGMVLYVFTV